MKTTRFFTLLEIMVAATLLLMATGAIGWKIHGFLEKRRFRLDIEQFKSRLRTVHRMAVSMQADWEGALQFDGKKWTFQAACIDPPQSKKYSPIPFHLSEVILNGKSEKSYPFFFFSSGAIWPTGTFLFRGKDPKEVETLEVPKLLGNVAGDGIRQLGPVHPDESHSK